MQGLLEGGRGCLQLALQQPVAALKLPDQPISLHHTTSDKRKETKGLGFWV